MDRMRRAHEIQGTPEPDRIFTYLTGAQMLATIRDLVSDLSIAGINGPKPPDDESPAEAFARNTERFEKIKLIYPNDILLAVSHGGCIAKADDRIF